MKKLKYIIAVFTLVLVSSACSDYIENVDPLINVVEDERLTTESQVDFVVKGVQQRFAVVASQLACQADLLSDQMIYTSDIASASFPSFEEIDKGAMTLDNATVATTYRQLGELRFFADNLVERAGQITFNDQTKKALALFTGHFYAAVARYYSATTFGLTETQPGGIIDAGPFLTASQFLDDAITHYKAALDNTTDAATKRVVNSLIAKVYFAKKDYANAATYAAAGMVSGDKDFQALNSDVSNIYYWGFAGAGRVQIAVNERFNTYITQDPKEAARIKISSVKGTSGKTYYWQMKYDLKSSAFQVMTWKENNLMLAECALRGAGSGDALALVNAVRAAYSISALTSIDIAGLLVERDKELFCQGTRLMDQNRTDNWHLAATTWHYMPIPRTERNANPNLPQ